MKKFWIHIIVGLVFFNLTISAIFFEMNKGLKAFEWETFDKLELLFNNEEEQDVLFIGSSRAHYSINVLLLEKLIGKKCLNAGLEGAKIFEMEVLLNGYLSKHKDLKEVFIMPDTHSFLPDSIGSYNKIVLSNYLNNDTIFKYMKNTDGKKTFFWKYLPYSILTEFDDYTRAGCIKGLVNGPRFEAGTFTYKGYVSLNQNFKMMKDERLGLGEVHAKEQAAFERMIRTCLKRKINVTIIPGAYLESYSKERHVEDFYRNLYLKLGNLRTKVNFGKIVNYTDTLLFKDQTHLNYRGAERYTLDLYKMYFKDGR